MKKNLTKSIKKLLLSKDDIDFEIGKALLENNGANLSKGQLENLTEAADGKDKYFGSFGIYFGEFKRYPYKMTTFGLRVRL